jgi:hypothetical protein
MLRPIYMLYPSRTAFPSPFLGRLSHPRARHYRRYLEVVLLAILRVDMQPTPLVDRYRGGSPARMRPGGSPGPRRPFVGSGGWTRTDRVERVLLACSARARARDIARTAPRKTGPNRAPAGAARRHGLLPPTALPCACQRTRSLGSLRDASASNQLASDCRRQPLGSQGPIPASPPCCMPRCPGCCRPAASRICPG